MNTVKITSGSVYLVYNAAKRSRRRCRVFTGKPIYGFFSGGQMSFLNAGDKKEKEEGKGFAKSAGEILNLKTSSRHYGRGEETLSGD
ncbi:hypothetical protein E3N88_10331 [Mikania micrantha]|uniref:Uncharacterized protein n=1 Tax=Mikania micrantha TaxID=192012 RepID=A0A5N6PAB7_9ASTR|nr:hypothetical protein E3N88_10331 [Mikania micrantha]